MLRRCYQSRGYATTLKPKWLLTEIPWSSLLMLLVNWAGRPASLPLWRMCSEILCPCQVRNHHSHKTSFSFPKALILDLCFTCYFVMLLMSHVSGSGAQTWQQQQTVLLGGWDPVTWCDRQQDAGTDGAQGLSVELCAEAQIQPGRLVLLNTKLSIL